MRAATAATAAIAVSLLAGGTSARGAYVPKPVAPEAPCGVSGGGLPDPAETKACLARRYKPPEPKPALEPDKSKTDKPGAAPHSP